MNTGPRRRGAAPATTGMAAVDERAIVANDVFCLYPLPRGTVAALRGLTLTVDPGQRLVVQGPNGSGKTSLLRVLTGEVTPSAGTVRVAGLDLAGADERTRVGLRRHRLGLIDQHSSRVLRPELDALDNVALQLRIIGVARAPARRRALLLLDELQLGGLADRRPGQLSGGQAQRVAVCAALAHDPQIVLADEPSGELDTESADAVYDLLAAAAARTGATLLVVSHDARAARIADRVVRIRDGRLSEQWSPGMPGVEELVVDDRGWVRLPESMRRAAGAGRAVSAELGGTRIVLTGRDRSPPATTTDVPSPATTAAATTAPATTAAPMTAAPMTAAATTTTAPMTAAATARPQTAPRGDPSAASIAPAARLRAVTVRYGERTVLAGVDLELTAGRVTVLRGRSGSGKSTLLRILLGLADPHDGDVELAGTALRPLSRAARADLRRAHAAVALQFGALAEVLDVDENLALARALRALPPHDLLVADVIGGTDLTAVRARAVRLLSGGERQRVALSRSLVVDCALLVLDEPTSAQDEAHADGVGAALRWAAQRGTAVLAATHDPRLVAIADDVVELD